MSQVKIGVLLVNLGTPEAPTAKAVRKYLAEFLWDRRVVDVPRPIWWLILNGIILRFRPGRVAKGYQSIWTEDGSPLMAISKRQQRALQDALDQQGLDIPVELAMTYGEPSMETAGRNLRQKGVEKMLVLPLYPQFSASTTGAVFDRLAKGLKRCPHLPEMRFVNEYHQHPLYIQALTNSVKEYWKEHGKGDKLMMSFHGIPQRYADNGDPYPRQCKATADALAHALDLKENEYLCTFQSRFGREEWVKPYTDHTLEDWGKSGVKRVDIISPAFSADCLETLEELEEENRENFLEAGGKEYHYIPCLNDRSDHIEMMSELVKTHICNW
ncbi:ferrochelatase [Bermanella marisrubri]|uniref:Ferrochelatase n=1 Tax=Bermanella marisrubri TaxID=207949 RepID=Q1N3F6_9GAMM|nr:ferrochelatase [Bermanella marisrubri]EAT12635.1 Ferrochelatase [Oceanobacter sp. RED65] [Bermanella marisrubri]QIZ85238.1 ferrochelatase [Bermanella marisrubri]